MGKVVSITVGVVLVTVIALLGMQRAAPPISADGGCGSDESGPVGFGITPFLTVPYSMPIHHGHEITRTATHSTSVITAMFDHTHPTGTPVEPLIGGYSDGVVVLSDGNHSYRSCQKQGSRSKPGIIAYKNLSKGYLYYEGHNGTDYAVVGDAIAAAPGWVEHVGWDKCYGNYVILDHWNGYRTFYAHLEKTYVSDKGAPTVERGAPLGKIGATGCVTGIHLHFSVFHEHFNEVIGRNIWYPTDPYGYPDAPYIDPLIVNGPSEDGQEMSVWLWQDLIDIGYSLPELDNPERVGGEPIFYAEYVGSSGDVNVSPGQSFAVWFRVKNAGVADWPTGTYYSYHLVNIDGTDLGAGIDHGLTNTVASGDQQTWHLNMTAPRIPGTYTSRWVMRSHDIDIGPEMSIAVTVEEGVIPKSRPIDAILISTSDYLFLKPGESGNIFFDIQNTGSLTWSPDQGFRLENTGGTPLGAATPQLLLVEVSPGQVARWALPVTAPKETGVYLTQWQMMYRDESFGPTMTGLVFVTPENVISYDPVTLLREWLNGLKNQITTEINRFLEELKQQFMEWLQRELERAWREFWESLLRQCCGANALAPAALLLGAWGVHRRRGRTK